MRRVFAVLLLLLGVPLLAAGAAAAALVGPGNTVSTGTHSISTRGSAIVTASRLLQYVGPTLHVTARTASGNGDVFIGVGHRADVQSYLSGTSYSTVTGFRPPWQVTQDSSTAGGFSPVPKPAGLPFWAASAHGPGQQELTWQTTDGSWNVVLTTAAPSTGATFDVSAGLTVGYLFEALIVVAVAGLALCALGVVLLRRKRGSAGASGPPRDKPARMPAAASAAGAPAADTPAVPAAAASPAGVGNADKAAVPPSDGAPAAAGAAAPAPVAATDSTPVADASGAGLFSPGSADSADSADRAAEAPPSNAGEPPWEPAPPPPHTAPRDPAETGALGRLTEPGGREPGELFRPRVAAGMRGAAGPPRDAGPRPGPDVTGHGVVSGRENQDAAGRAGSDAAGPGLAGTDTGFRSAKGWPVRSAPLDPGEPDPDEDPAGTEGPGALSGSAHATPPGPGPVTQAGPGPQRPPGPVDSGRVRPPEAAHGDEWAPPPPRPDGKAPQLPKRGRKRPVRESPED